MATKVQTMSLGKEALESQTSLPPPYQGQDGLEFSTLSNASSSSSLPQYDSVTADSSSAAGFSPTLSYQIENQGLGCIALPFPPRPHPIPVYAVTPSGQAAEKVYESVRPSRGSGNCMLYHVGSSSEVPVCTTTYRFGPGRPPKIRLLGPNSDLSALGTDQGPQQGDEEFEVIGKGCYTRAIVMRTHLGTFQWRYASKAERKAIGADSLVVLERVTTVAHAGGKTEEKYQRVAQLVRNEEYRTKGSGRSTAGNGGRLMMDMRDWSDRKDERRQMEMLAVSSCICLLKKEVDRRRMHQTMIIAGAAGGN